MNRKELNVSLIYFCPPSAQKLYNNVLCTIHYNYKVCKFTELSSEDTVRR